MCKGSKTCQLLREEKKETPATSQLKVYNLFARGVCDLTELHVSFNPLDTTLCDVRIANRQWISTWFIKSVKRTEIKQTYLKYSKGP